MNKNAFAPAPPMGWNSYDYYDTTVNEDQIRSNARFMAEHLRPFGWEYIVVDIQWYAHGAGSQRDKYQYIPFSRLEMDEYSRLLPDPQRFPSSAGGKGFAPLAQYIHSLGLKFGIHIMRGIPRLAAHCHEKIKNCALSADVIADPSSICGWNPDMYGVRNMPQGQSYYDSLLELYASWGVDYIKCDDICNTNLYRDNQYSARHEVEMLHNAIIKCGRPVVLSLSPGPALIDQAWHYETYANLWRITDDFWDDWRLLKDMFRRCELWQSHVSEGCYPDCDMLPVGYLGKGFGQERTTNFTLEEQRTMMTLWCLFGSPLMLGAEMTKLDEQTLSLLTNKKVLAMLTPSCRPRQIYLNDDSSVWASCNPETGEAYAALFNLKDETAQVTLALADLNNTLRDLGLAAELSLDSLSMTELWTRKSADCNGCAVSCELPAHGCAAYQLNL